MLELDPIAQHGQQNDDGSRRGLWTTDCKQSRLTALQSWSWMTTYHCSSYSNDIRHCTAETGGNYNRLRRSIIGLVPLQDGEYLDVKSTCFGIFQKFWRGIAVNYYWVSRTTFFKNSAMSYEEWTGELGQPQNFHMSFEFHIQSNHCSETRFIEGFQGPSAAACRLNSF